MINYHLGFMLQIMTCKPVTPPVTVVVHLLITNDLIIGRTNQQSLQSQKMCNGTVVLTWSPQSSDSAVGSRMMPTLPPHCTLMYHTVHMKVACLTGDLKSIKRPYLLRKYKAPDITISICLTRNATKMVSSMENQVHKEERLKELGMFIPEKTRLSGTPNDSLRYLKADPIQEGKDLMAAAQQAGIRSNVLKLPEGRLAEQKEKLCNCKSSLIMNWIM